MRCGAGTASAAVLVVLLGLTGCSSADAPPASGPSPETSVSPTPSSAPSAPTSPAPATRPDPVIALVTHATVPALDLTPRLARRLAAGRVPDWAALGRDPRPLRLVRSVRAVERDPDAVGLVRLARVGPSVNVAAVDGVDPVADDPRATSLTLVGDLMLVRGVPDPAAALAPFGARLRAADLAVGNLESTLSVDGEPTQEDFFGGSPALLQPIARAGLDAVSLANNHVGDYGERALLQTVASLRNSPVVPFGAGPDLAAASEPAYLEAGGTRFAFVGFNAIGETPRAEPDAAGALSVRMPPRTGPLVAADLDHVAAVVRRAGRRADVVVVMPHWGDQYTHTPWAPEQHTVARRLVAAGADLVAGGHPHWVQGVERFRGVPVLHSLGNFVFDMDFAQETLEGVAAETVWWGGELKQVRLVPYRMGTDDFAPRPLAATDPAGADILADVWSTSRGPWARR